MDAPETCPSRKARAACPALAISWLLRSEAMWRRAHEIVGDEAGIDVGDVYHALQCLDLTPIERLRRGLGRGRLRLYAR